LTLSHVSCAPKPHNVHLTKSGGRGIRTPGPCGPRLFKSELIDPVSDQCSPICLLISTYVLDANRRSRTLIGSCSHFVVMDRRHHHESCGVSRELTCRRSPGCKADPHRGSMSQFIAARCVVPGHTACRTGSGRHCDEGRRADLLSPNCWGACWDEMPVPGDSGATSDYACHQGDSSKPACRKEHHLGKVIVRELPTCTFANSCSMIGVFG